MKLEWQKLSIRAGRSGSKLPVSLFLSAESFMSANQFSGRIPPHNLDAERAVLGALLLSGERIPDALEIVGADDFFDPRHEVLFGCLASMSEAGIPIEPVSVIQALAAKDEKGIVGGAGYVGELLAAVTSSAHITHHAGIVTHCSTLRRLIAKATEIIQSAQGTAVDEDAVKLLLDKSEQGIFEVSAGRDKSDATSVDDAISEAFKALEARSGSDGLPGLTTGFYDLDRLLAGLNGGDLVILAARPSMGKTAFALNLIENAVMSKPAWLGGESPTALMFSLEMGSVQLVNRLLCSRAQVDAHKLRTGDIDHDDRLDLNNAADDYRGAKLFIDDNESLTIMGLRSRARRIRSLHGLHLIVVDYLQLLKAPNAENRLQEISTISRSLKALARELDVPVIALAQLSRQVEQRDPPRPQLSDLRESGSIEQDADVVMMLYRAEYYSKYRTDESIGKAEIIIAKHRNGPTGDVKLGFRPEFMRFTNLTYTEVETIPT